MGVDLLWVTMMLQLAPFQCGQAPQHLSCHNTRYWTKLILAMRISCGICTRSGFVVPSEEDSLHHIEVQNTTIIIIHNTHAHLPLQYC